MAGNGDQAFEGGFKLYHYNPNLAANTIFVILFGAASIAHLVYLVWKRTWYFIPFVIGCLCAWPDLNFCSLKEIRKSINVHVT